MPRKKITRSETGVRHFGNDPQSEFEPRGRVMALCDISDTRHMITINTSNPALYVTTLVVSSATSYYTVFSNYTDGIYPTNQDTIAIPLVATTALLAILLLLSLSQYPLYKQLKSGKPSSLLATSIALLATTISSMLLIESTNYWFSPNHLGISALYFITFATYVIHQLNFYKKFASRRK